MSHSMALRLAFVFVLSSSYWLVSLFAAIACAARVTYNWEITALNIARTPNGTRYAIGVNDQLPIPPVVATLGDTLVFNVENSLQEPTTLHIHGYFYNGTSYFDGGAMVSSCSIAPGSSFTYEILAAQTGTFWIHGHTHHQNADGLRGPLVVRDPHERYEYHKDFVFALEEWYAMPFKERLAASRKTTDGTLPDTAFPDMLINGHGCERAGSLVFDAGKTYRIRLVNMASTMWYEFSLGGHTIRVIELDGVASTEMAVQTVQLAPAQRVSVLVTANSGSNSNSTACHYTVKQYSDLMDSRSGKNPLYCQKPIEYSLETGMPATINPASPPDKAPATQVLPFSDISMTPLDNEALFLPDRHIRLEIGSGIFSGGELLQYINNVTFAKPLVPALYTALTMGSLALDSRVYGPRTNTIVLRSMEVVELVVWNNGASSHPMHLHGHTFQLVEYGCASKARCDGDNSNMPIRAGAAPMRRDTVTVGAHQYVAIRFRADNPGMWLFHCHLDTHHALGMAMVFAEAPEVLQLTPDMPRSIPGQCLLQGIKISGNAAGNSGLDMRNAPIALARLS